MRYSNRRFLKTAEFLKSENTKLFADKFKEENNKSQELVKDLSDRFYSLFGEWEKYDDYRKLVSELKSFNDALLFVKSCEEALFKVSNSLKSFGISYKIADDTALQYLWRYVDEIKSGNSQFFSRIDDIYSSLDEEGEFLGQFSGELLNILQSILRKERKKSLFSIPELAEKEAELNPLGAEAIKWIEERFKESKNGGEAHSVGDLISIVKTFKPIGDSLGTKISEFKSYSELSRWIDELSFENKEAYIVSIADAAQSDGMSEVIYEDDRWKVVLIGSTIAGQWWGRDTNFCISYLENNLYSKYSKEGNLDPYFIIDKWADSSNPMRKFTVAIEYHNKGSFKLSKSEYTMTDATNKAISLGDIINYLGSDYDKILNKINLKAREKKQSTGKDNEEKILDIIKSGDISKIKKYEKEIVADNNLTEAFAKKLSEIDDTSSLQGLIKQVSPKLAEKNPLDFLKNYHDKDWAKNYLDTAWKNLAEKNPLYFLENYHDKDWAENYLDTAWKNMLGRPDEADKNIKYFLSRNSGKDWVKTYLEKFAKTYPINLLTNYYNQEWAKPFLGISAERTARDNGPYFLKELYQRAWLKPYLEPYLEVAAENMAEKEPIAFISRYSDEAWGKNYKDIALKEIQKIMIEKPIWFMENYRGAVWAKPYLATLNEEIKEMARSNPADFLYYHHTNPNGGWIGLSLLEIAAESLSKKDPSKFLYSYSGKSWAKPYINTAAEILAKEKPESIVFWPSQHPWATTPVGALGGRTWLEYAEDRLEEKKRVSKASNKIKLKLIKLSAVLRNLGLEDYDLQSLY